jgi:hypothetical protein
MSFEILCFTNVRRLIYKSMQILIYENIKFLYLKDVFEFIHHPKYGTMITIVVIFIVYL